VLSEELDAVTFTIRILWIGAAPSVKMANAEGGMRTCSAPTYDSQRNPRAKAAPCEHLRCARMPPFSLSVSRPAARRTPWQAYPFGPVAIAATRRRAPTAKAIQPAGLSDRAHRSARAARILPPSHFDS